MPAADAIFDAFDVTAAAAREVSYCLAFAFQHELPMMHYYLLSFGFFTAITSLPANFISSPLHFCFDADAIKCSLEAEMAAPARGAVRKGRSARGGDDRRYARHD